MSDRPQYKSLPEEVEPRKFAQKGVELRGSVPAEKLNRLAQAVSAIEAVEAVLYFDKDDQGYRIVTGAIDATVKRECQRCLGDISQQLHSDVSLAMVWDDEQAKALSIYEPWLVDEDSANLYNLIEEEILLNMPYLAYHDTDCVDKSLLQAGQEVEAEVEAKPNPFAKLKELKGLKKD